MESARAGPSRREPAAVLDDLRHPVELGTARRLRVSSRPPEGHFRWRSRMRLTVNGVTHDVDAPSDMPLL